MKRNERYWPTNRCAPQYMTGTELTIAVVTTANAVLYDIHYARLFSHAWRRKAYMSLETVCSETHGEFQSISKVWHCGNVALLYFIGRPVERVG